MGSFSLISVGAGSCPNSAKQPPTLQNKYREAYGYCQGNRWIFIWFVKELETACCILIQRLFQATGIVWKQGQLQHGQQRQQKQAWVRLGYEGEGKPDTKLHGVLEMRRKSSAKYVKEVEGKLNMFASKRLCGGFCQGWREQDDPRVGALGTGRCPSRCRRLHRGCCWDLPLSLPCQACGYGEKQPGWPPSPRARCWAVAGVAGVVTPNSGRLTQPGLHVLHTSGEQ